MTGSVSIAFDPFAGPEIERSSPTTDGQREIWTAVQMGGNASLAYNEAVTLRLRGTVDPNALRIAIDAIVARHECLRATVSRDGLTMLVAPPAPAAIAWRDLTTLSSDARDESLRDIGDAAVRTPFDLESGPLAQITVAVLAPDDYVLLIAAHHIICDGWSFGVLAADLGRAYESELSSRSGSATPVRDDAERFTDYAASLRTAEATTAQVNDERFWVTCFATTPEPVELPTDRARPASKSYSSAREDYHFSADVTRSVKALGATIGSSLFATMLAGWSALLARLSGQDDLVVGIASAGQVAAQRPELVGHCVNTLPIRVQPMSALPFDQFVGRVRSATLDAIEHQGVGFGRIVERLAIPRDPSRLPLVSVVFNLDRALTAEKLAFGGLAVSLNSIPRVAENFDLFVNAVEVSDGMVLECQYNTDLFDGATVRRWLASYERLLRSAVAAPPTPVGRLAIRTPEDDATLARCNDAALAVPANLLVHDMIETQVRANPSRVAVDAGDAVLTYGELEALANQIARTLRAAGVKRGALVGLAVERTPTLLAALFGILKSGAGYVPLDTSYPAERLQAMADDAGLAALVTEESVLRDVTLTAPFVLSLDGDADSIAAYSTDPLPFDSQSATPDDTAYVIFTSGSTGRPKGVLVPHRSIVNLLMSVQITPGLSSDDVVLAITTLSFDIAVSELVLPLTVGARIVLTTRDTASDGAVLRAVIESRGVTFIDATPATYRLLVAAGWMGGKRLRLICTGEALPSELARELLPRASELWNGYGPTETTVWSTFARVEAPVRRVLIGRPVANTRIAIRDRQGELVPVGVPGELFIGGQGVATGYLGRPDLTAERFSVDTDVKTRRWYRTGDLVRLLPTGELECLGRTDDQVKVRGYRIEPGEISAAVCRWPGVREAVVVAREDRANDVRLVGYVVADDGVTLDDAFRAYLRRTLPDYMVPAAFVRLDRLPLTPSGKIDKRSLPAVDSIADVARSAFVAPRTPSEELLAGLWMEALGVPRVSVDDDFFTLGGHSLLASQILSRLRRDHGIEITFRRIFETPTIAGLAERIDQDAASGKTVVPKAGIPHRLEEEWSPLSALQERLWLLEKLEPRRRQAHSHPASWQLTGPLDADALEQALRALFVRHPMLRTSFHLHEGERRQRVNVDPPFAMQRLDLSALSPKDQASALETYFINEQSVPFDLDEAPLFRATLLRLGETRHRLYTLQHGMVWDGWSFDLFLRDLSELYAAEAQGRPAVLPPLAITYGDFAAWQLGWLSSPAAEAQRVWWHGQLADVHEGVSLPVDHPRPMSSSHVGDQLSLAFDADEIDRLNSMARACDGTLFMVLFAGFSIMLERYSGQRDLLIASPMRARTRPELEEIVGPFVNTVALRTQIPPRSSFADIIRTVRERSLDTYGNQELPFEVLGARLPAIRAVFSMQDARQRPSRMDGIEIEQVHVPLRYAMNDVTLWMLHFPTRLHAVLNFSTDVIDRESAQLFLAQLRGLLLSVCEAPNALLETIAFTAPHADAAPAFALPDTSNSAARSWYAAVAEHATAAPSDIAVQWRGGTLSYGALWARAGKLASVLQARGIASGDVVIVELPHGGDLVVALVAALRAGARVVLMDAQDAPAYRARLRDAAAAKLSVSSSGDESLHALEASASADDGVPPENEGDLLFLSPAADDRIGRGIVSARRLEEQVHALREALSLASGASTAHALPVASASWIPTLLAVVASGARAVLISQDVISDPLDFGDEIADASPNVLIATAEGWRGTLDAEWRGGIVARGMVVGGGLSSTGLRALAEHGTVCHQTFGAAEDAGLTAMRRVSSEGEQWFIGAPIGTAALRVVTEQGHDCPRGVPGQLEWRVGDGAWTSIALRVRRNASGQLQILDDAGEMLWLGGTLVASAIIEGILRSLPGVIDAAIAEHRDRRGTVSLVAHLQPRPDSTGPRAAEGSGPGPSVAAIRTGMLGRAPHTHLPFRVTTATELPRRGDGTLDRLRLPSPFASAGSSLESDAPRGEAEQVLAQVWCEVLGIRAVSRHDNFFSFGGTSLLCFRVIDRIRERTGVRLSPRALLVGTFEQVAKDLSREQESKPYQKAT